MISKEEAIRQIAERIGELTKKKRKWKRLGDPSMVEVMEIKIRELNFSITILKKIRL